MKYCLLRLSLAALISVHSRFSIRTSPFHDAWFLVHLNLSASFACPTRDRYTKRAREQEEKINSGQSENQEYGAWIRSGFSIDSIDFRIIYVRNCVFCKENFWKFSFFFWKNWRDEKKYAYLLCTFECRLNIKSMKIIDARNEMERFYFENREEMKFKIPKSKHIDIFLSLQYIMWSIIQGKWDWNEANIVIFIESFTSIQPFSSRKQKLESTFHPFA